MIRFMALFPNMKRLRIRSYVDGIRLGLKLRRGVFRHIANKRSKPRIKRDDPGTILRFGFLACTNIYIDYALFAQSYT
ncbi:hypothetical protein [Thermoproteus tenax]|nr:hypothetical protein [Thermoproteus tenax]